MSKDAKTIIGIVFLIICMFIGMYKVCDHGVKLQNEKERKKENKEKTYLKTLALESTKVVHKCLDVKLNKIVFNRLNGCLVAIIKTKGCGKTFLYECWGNTDKHSFGCKEVKANK